MPYAPAYRCKVGGCRHYQPCPKHGPKQPIGGGGYYGTAEWRRTSAAQLEREPWCRYHLALGVRVKATIAHHIVERTEGGTDEQDNLASACRPCHSAYHAIAQRENRN